MTPHARAVLHVTDFEAPPQRISDALELAPTRTWLKGETIGGSVRRSASNGWALERAAQTVDVEALVVDLLGRLPTDSSARLSRVIGSWELQCSVVVTVRDETPALHWSAPTIRRLAELGASLDVDLYLSAD